MSPSGSSHTSSPYSSQRVNRSLPKGEDMEDDKQSTMSQASGIPRTEQTLDALRLVAGHRVRHARCAPEFLEEIAVRDTHIYLKKAASKKFKILTNSEARSFYISYINNYTKTEANSLRNDNDNLTNGMPSPIVFAVTVYEGEIKCVDYFMTWRGHSKAHQAKEYERQAEYFDSGFRRLAKALDDDYRRISSLRKHDNLSPLHAKFDLKSRSTAPSSKSRPPGIAVSAAEEEPQKVIAAPPVSATDSVMSLPLLNMVRNVPFSHRVPLRVANPDRLSIISDIDVTTIQPETFAKVMSAKLEQASNALSGSAVRRAREKKTNEPLKRSSASIRSSDTRSSESSRSSRSSSRSKNQSGRHSSLGDQRDPSRRADDRPAKDEGLVEFLIVFLGDKLDRDTTSWHGLERQTSVRSLPPDRHSPWMGPLARADSIGYRPSPAGTPQHSDDDSENERPKAPPVIPLKPMMEAMGLIPQYYRSPPVVPGGQYISVGAIGSPQSNQSPYLYSSPRLDASLYVPTWMPQMQLPPNGPSSRPPSQAYSTASYASPYMQAHANPF